MATDYSNLFGSMGPVSYTDPGEDARPIRDTSTSNWVGPDGTRYARLAMFGSDPSRIQAFLQAQGIPESALINDPVHGLSIPEGMIQDLDKGVFDNPADLAMVFGPLAATLGPAMYAGAAAGGGGATTSFGQAFGNAVGTAPTNVSGGLSSVLGGNSLLTNTNDLTSLMSDTGGGENILEGMDLSSGMTNFDSGPGFYGNTTGPLSGSGLSPLTRILQGGGGLDDYLKLGGQVLPSALGAFGASQQADAFGDAQNQYLGLGAPYRSLLQQSYQPGFDLENEPGFKNAMDVGLNTFMRAASAGNARGVSSGNPYASPGAMMEAQKYLTGSLAMPYLTNYRSGLSGAGQLGVGPSANFGSNAIQSQGGVYDSIGYGLGEVLNPRKDYGIVLEDGRIRIPREWNY